MIPTTAEQLEQVREAAVLLHDWHGWDKPLKYPDAHPWDDDFSDRDSQCVAIAKHVLDSIPPDPQTPVTAEWLRECWGFRGSDNDGLVSPVCHSIGGGPMVELYYDPYGGCDSWSMGLGGEEIELPDRFQTRFQAAQFFTALGIEPKGEGV